MPGSRPDLAAPNAPPVPVTQADAAGDVERVARTTAAMKDFEAKQIAAKIVSLYDEVARRYGWENSHALASGE
jgi:hypothetical protein